MNVDPIARWYRWIEYAAFGRSLERCRFLSMNAVRGASSILILGEGDGRYLARLLRINAGAKVAVIEASARMVKLARDRIAPPDAKRVSFIHGDAHAVQIPAAAYDAIVTNFFLDCFSAEAAADLIGRLTTALKPGGTWVISEFQQPDAGVAFLHARLWLFVMYGFFRLTTGLRPNRLPPYRKLMENAGLKLVSETQRRLGLMVSQVWKKTEP